MSCADELKNFFAGKVAVVKSLISIPSRKESMAGVIILYVFTNSIATSIWMFNAWTPYIYLTFDKSNWHVGLMSAVNGVFELSTAFVSGYLADRVLGPSRTLRYAVMFGIMTLSMVLVGIWTDKTWLLVFAQMCEGTYMGFSFTCLESVFAQCMRKGERDRLYSIKFAFEAAGPIVGLILTITLFLIVGDEWNKSVLRNVMTAGLALHLGSLTTFLCTFVPLPCHLDRKKATAAAAGDGAATVGAGGAYHGPASDVAIIADRFTGEAYETEDPRLPVEEEESNTLPPLYLSRRAEMINQARTAVLEARSFLPRLGGAYEPSVCTAREGPHGEFDVEDGVNSQVVGSQSFFSTGGGGGRASRRSVGDADYFSDDGTFGANREGSEAEHTRNGAADVAKACPSGARGPAPVLDDDDGNRKIVGYVDPEYDNASSCRKSLMDRIPLKKYPVIVVIADMILIVGSGMTTQYFSLFMMNIYGIQPVVLTSLTLINSFIISFMAILNGVLGRKYGRVRALLPPKYLGSLILLYMALTRERPSADGTYPFVHPAKRVIMCICYVVRNAMMNCSSSLSRALIMDLVNERNHGRWNALESVQSAGWSGTALIGGVVADNFGYGTSFLVTFGFHFFSCLMLTPLTVRNDAKLPIPIYEDEAGALTGTVTTAAGEAKDHDGGDGMSVATGASVEQKGKPWDSSSSSNAHRAHKEEEPRVAALTVENVMRIASSAVLHKDGPVNRSVSGASDEEQDSCASSHEQRES